MKQRAKKIAEERIENLYTLATKEQKTHPEDSRRYIEMMRNIATKHNITITDKKKTFCKNCNTLLNPQTSTTRIRDNRKIITCKHCNTIKRLGLPTTSSAHEHEDDD